MLKKKLNYIILAIDILILVVALSKYIYDANTLEKHPYNACDFVLNAGSMAEDGSYYMIDSCDDTFIHFIFGPYLSLSRGSYRVTVNYETTTESSFFWMFSKSAKEGAILENEPAFDPTRTSMDSTFYLNSTVHDLEFRVIYMNDGTLKFYSILIEETMSFDNIVLLCVLLTLMLLNAAFFGFQYYKKAGKKMQIQTKYVVMAMIGTVLLSCMPVFMDYIINTHDYDFHAVRIEGMKDAWLSGQFPARMQPTWFGGAGYACSIFYGELFLSLPAFLRLIGVPIQTSYQIFQICINIATCLVAYYSMKKMTKNRYAAMFGSMIYTLAPYRLLDLYFRNAVGEATAMIFLPLVVYGMWRILREEETEENQVKALMEQKKGKRFAKTFAILKVKRGAWLPLALGMTGLIQSHILTCEMVAIFLVIACLVYIKRLFVGRRIFIILQAAFAALLLNAWFLVPFLEYFRGAYKVTTIEPSYIQKMGAYISQIFMMFINFNATAVSVPTSEGLGSEMQLSVGLALGIGALMVIALAWTRGIRESKRLRMGLFLTIIGIVSLFMATNVFPWDTISDLSDTSARLVSTIQFPWRFLAPATCLLAVATALGIGYALDHMHVSKVMLAVSVIGILTIISSVHFMNQWVSGVGPYRAYDENRLNINYASSGNEYLPEGLNISICIATHSVDGTEEVIVKDYEVDGTNCTAEVVNIGAQDEITIPFINYPGYQAVCKETGKKMELGETENHTLTVVIPEGFSGTVKVSFAGKWYWRVAEAVTCLSIISYALYRIIDKKRACPKTNSDEQ